MRKFLSSITGNFLLLAAGSILIWLFTAFYMIDRINKVNHFFTLQAIIDENITRAAIIKGTSEILLTGSTGLNFNRGRIANDPDQVGLEMTTSLSAIGADPVFIQNPGFQHRIRTIMESFPELNRLENEFISLLMKKGNIESGLIEKTLALLNDPILRNPSNSKLSLKIQQSLMDYMLHNDPNILDDLLNLPEIGLAGEAKGSLPAGKTNIQHPEELLMVVRNLADILRIDQKLGIYMGGGLATELKLLNLQIINQLTSLRSEFSGYSSHRIKTSLNRFYWFIGLSGLAIVFWIIYLAFYVVKSLDKLQESLNNLSHGVLPNNQLKFFTSEFSLLAENIHSISLELAKKTEYSKQIAAGNPPVDGSPFSPQDELGNALFSLHEKLKHDQEEHEKLWEEQLKRNWHYEGLDLFGKLLRSEKESVEELSFILIRELAKYLGASHCSLFLLNEENTGNPQYDLIASLAFDRRKYLNKTILPGEGLTGTCVNEKETIYLTELPEDYIKIKSGLGESSPRTLLIVPLKLKNNVYGILELASFNRLSPHEISFVEELALNMAAALQDLKNSVNTANSLDNFQKQLSERLRQEEKIYQNIFELEQKLEASRHKEVEISGILNAVYASSLVAEYSLNGRISSINHKFARLLEITPGELIGKHLSEFTETEKYSEEYRKLWQDVRKGEIRTQVEKFRSMKGREIWLYQTFTPIADNEGNITRILNIALDITQTRVQQESLEKQTVEIAVKNQEMKTLTQAVNESMIKCEISPEGIIEEANSNYLYATGLGSRELTGKNLRLFLRESEKEQFDTIMNQVLKAQSYSGVVKRTKPTGEEVWLMSSFTPVTDETGRVRKIYFLAQDITEKKLRYQLLEEANREIERLKGKLRIKNL